MIDYNLLNIPTTKLVAYGDRTFVTPHVVFKHLSSISLSENSFMLQILQSNVVSHKYISS